jgi:hypothetical protein
LTNLQARLTIRPASTVVVATEKVVFAPYAVADIHQVYPRDGTLNEVWEAPFLRTIRQWDDRHRPEPEDAAARQTLTDEAYYERMVADGRELEALSREAWEGEYVGRK